MPAQEHGLNGVREIDPGAVAAGAGIELRLWRVNLDAFDSDSCAPPSAAETARAARFARPADGRRYLASHAAMRQLLAVPQAWTEGPHGKPALASPPPHFNLSRRDGVALIGLSATHELGVDIEPLRGVADADALAQAHFTPAEREAMAAQRGAARQRAFLLGWTRKEACLKALGTGLAIAPSSFECGVAEATARVAFVVAGQRRTVLVHSPRLAGDANVVSWAVVLH